MKNRIWFRLALKAVGILLIAGSLPKCFQILAYTFTWAVDGTLPVTSAFGSMFSWIAMLGEFMPLAIGVYLLAGGDWLVKRIIPAGRFACTECGYDVSHGVKNRCPECGAAIHREDDHESSREQ